MTRSLLPVAALLLGAAFLFLAGGVSGLLLPLRGAHEGMGALSLGLLGTGWAVGYVLGCLRVPRLVARVGHVRAFGVVSALASLSLLASSLFVHAWAWIALRAVTGFAFAGAAMIVESWLVERSDPAQRGRVFGTYTMVILAASTLGQLSLVLGDVTGTVFFVAAAMLCTLALIPTAVSSSASPSPLLDARLDLRGMWASSPLAMVGAVLIGLSNGTFGTLAAVYADRLSLSVGAVTLFVALPVLAGAAAQVPVGRLSDRLDRRRVLAGVAILALGADLAFLLLQPSSAAAAIGLSMLFGAAIYSMYPVLVAHANDHAPPGASIRTSGTLLMLFGLGSIAGPALTGGLMSAIGPRGLFAVTLAAHASLLGYTLWRTVRRAPVALEDKEPFHRQAPLSTPQTLPFGHADDAALVEEGVDPVGDAALPGEREEGREDGPRPSDDVVYAVPLLRLVAPLAPVRLRRRGADLGPEGRAANDADGASDRAVPETVRDAAPELSERAA